MLEKRWIVTRLFPFRLYPQEITDIIMMSLPKRQPMRLILNNFGGLDNRKP